MQNEEVTKAILFFCSVMCLLVGSFMLILGYSVDCSNADKDYQKYCNLTMQQQKEGGYLLLLVGTGFITGLTLNSVLKKERKSPI